MYTIAEMRERLNAATEGALWALNLTAEANGLSPHVWLVPGGPQGTLVLLWATNTNGESKYFDSVLIAPDKGLESQLGIFLTVREIKSKTVQAQRGLARLAQGIEPEEMSDRSLN